MAITRPVTKTIISSPAWGIPITDAVNANTTDIAALKPTAWTAPTLTNGWIAYDSNRIPQYRKIGDMVYIRGLIKNGTLGTVAFNLPVGFRPTIGNMGFLVNANENPGTINVETSGNIIPITGSTSYFYLQQLFFSTI